MDLSAKEMVLGIQLSDNAKAYPVSTLRKRPGLLRDEIAGMRLTIEISAGGEVVRVRDDRGTPIPPIFSYWFAWQAFHPRTLVYQGEK